MNEKAQEGLLVISRHTESEWNLLGKWTGLTDIDITDKGKKDAEVIGAMLSDISIDKAYTSDLIRTKQTLDGILKGMGLAPDAVEREAALPINERDYGDLAGMNKWDVLERVGEEEFTGIRRGWDHPIPNGETLADVYRRVVPFFEQMLLSQLQAGKHILIVAHGNSIRALMKYLEDIPEEKIAEVEMGFGEVLLYRFDKNSNKPVSKESRQAEITKTHA